MGKRPASENSKPDLKAAIQQLLRGRDFATELQNMLSDTASESGRASAGELAEKIEKSFAETLSVFTSGDSISGESRRVPPPVQVGSDFSGGRSSLDSGESGEKTASKNRRGLYTRRKALDYWTSVTPTMEDGYAWRKYGQKEILNAKHPRCYFRCTHKYDQSCRATKQVQRIEEEKIGYQTTYFGHHTCTIKPKAQQIILNSETAAKHGLILSFCKEEGKELDAQSELSNDFSTPSFPNLSVLESSKPTLSFSKNNTDYEDVGSDERESKANPPTTQGLTQISSSDKEKIKELDAHDELSNDFSMGFFPDLRDFESSKPTMLFSRLESDYEDMCSYNVYNCVPDMSQDFGMDDDLKYCLDDDFRLDEIDFI